MSVTDKLWDAFSTVIKMNDKVVSQAAAMAAQQAKIEDLTARVICLEPRWRLPYRRGSPAAASDWGSNPRNDGQSVRERVDHHAKAFQRAHTEQMHISW